MKLYKLDQVSNDSNNEVEFGRNLRDWEHSICRGEHSNEVLRESFELEPVLLRTRFKAGQVADAYLAAFVEWFCHVRGMSAPHWVHSEERVVADPWYADTDKIRLRRETPEPFVRRRLFTIPCEIFPF